MKAVVLMLIGVLLTALACTDNDDSQLNIEGQYIGTFERNGNNSNVELSFVDGVFSGESEIVKFPAICNGNYSVQGNSIEFENQCVWTAEFDWTLILGDSWNYTFQNNVLNLTKSNGDTYTLTKQ